MDLGRTSKIFSKVAEVGPDFVASSFGAIGEKIFSLFETLGNHPETDGFFFDDQDLNLRELFDVGAFAKGRGMEAFISRLPEIAEVFSSEKLRSARIPGRNSYAARLLRKPMKDAARAVRRPQRLGSSSFIRFMERNWSCCPADFSRFRRNLCTPSPFSLKLEDAVRKFGEIGCPFLALASEDLLSRYHRPKTVCGYKRLSVMDACCIMARSMGLVVRERIVAARSPSGWFRYSPFVVPLTFLDVPERVLSCLQEAEFNSDLYFEAVFDHYLAVVPFLGDRLEWDLPGENNFPEVADFVSALREGAVPSVVLGERDGECYFLCEWN